MFSIAALNESDSSGQCDPLAPTKEAQEFRLTQSYHEGLLKLQDKDYATARELFEMVLKDPLISSSQIGKLAGDSHLLHLRFLSLKNLALVYLQQGCDHYNSALNCYLQAVEIDSKDSVVWNKLGTLACSMGLLSTSRWAFEQGLLCSPNNWNCMEKLLEVLIAIGDEVSSLSVAELILRYWPSHFRALHVKNMIENVVSLPFAPRGIDKLEPKHIWLKFSEKRKIIDDRFDEGFSSKKLKQTAELQLSGATWEIMADAILGLLRPVASKLLEQENLLDTSLNGKFGSMSVVTTNIEDSRSLSFTNCRINIDLSSCSKIMLDLAGQEMCQFGENSANSVFDEAKMKDKEEHHQERRSMRLERLRSRKSGKEELDFTGGRDPTKYVLQTLESFILYKSGTSKVDYPRNSNGHCAAITYSSLQEYSDVTRFISKASKNCGAYHIGHMFLEEISRVNVTIQAYFTKILEIERLTRDWSQDRSAICSLFLAELFFDQGSMCTDESNQFDFFLEASYHLCKVIELVAMDLPNSLACVVDDTDGLTSSLVSTSQNDNILVSNIFRSNNVEDDVYKQSRETTSALTNKATFWVRFFWLSGCLSLLHVNKEKALKEFIICLSILRKGSETSDPVPLTHCRVKSITIEKIHNEINLLTLDAVLQKVNGDFMNKGLYAKCIDMLSPLLLSAKDVYLDVASASSKESEGVISLELRAIDVLISACQKADLMSNELYLKCHRRKMQLVIIAAGLSGFQALQNSDGIFHKASSTSQLGTLESVDKRWIDLVSEEIKDMSQIASKMRIIIDPNEEHACLDSLEHVIGDIQSLLLTIICSLILNILSHKVSIPDSFSPTDQSECCLLVDTFITFCKLQHLQPSVSAKAQVDLIVAVHDLLAEYGLCCAGRDINGKEGAFLKFAIKHLLALDMKLRSLNGLIVKEEILQKGGLARTNADCVLPTELVTKNEVENGKFPIDLNSDSTGVDSGAVIAGITNQAIDNETEKLELSIESALDQSFFCLYGLNINPDSSSEDDLAMHKNTSRGDYQTREQCADVFQYILPYAKALSRNGLIKLRRVLRSIRKHFPQPPDELILENSINKFLDSPELCEVKLYELSETDGNHEAMINLLFAKRRGPESLQNTAVIGCSSERYMEVYENLYYLIGQAEDTSATDKYPGFVLKKEGEEFVEQNSNLFKYDLLYNPLRFESWHKLANIYDEEVDLLLNDGSKHINILDWRKNSSLTQRVEIGRRRSRRCLLMSLSLAKASDQQSQIHELLALVYYDNIQNVVPFYDQRAQVPKRDATWRVFCQNSMKHFEKAFALKPEWLHAFYLGKLCEKLGYSHDCAFSYYNQAAALNPSAVDPVYRLHASRLKLLYTHEKRNLNVIQVVASYAFNQEAKEKILDMFSWTSEDLMNFEKEKDGTENLKKKSVSDSLMDEAWNVLYDDCLRALEICIEGELKHFHKARYILAQGYYRRGELGDLERAKEEISFCFKSSRSAFTINMWEIDGATKKGRRKVPIHSGNKRVLEVSLSESSRKFITCIRKYILFYLDLLGRTGDLPTLERAYTCLRADKKFYLCLCDIVPIAIGKYLQVLASSIRNAGAAVSTDNNSLEPYLDRMFSLFIDHVSILGDLISYPELDKHEICESNLCGYIHQYIDLLESGIRLDALEGVNERIRKRFKNPKLYSTSVAKIYKHASLAWCRALVMKLASITPIVDLLLDHGLPAGTLENDLLLYVDLQPDEFLSTTLLEGFTHSKGLDLNWYQTLSKIKDVCIRQASEDNLEALAALMRCSYNFFRESSFAALPSGIHLYTVSFSRARYDGNLWPEKGKVEFLDFSIPRKLLLWAYTLFHGRYTSISSVLKFCEDNAKSRMRRGGTSASISSVGNVPVGSAHTVEAEDNPCTYVSASLAPHQEDAARISNALVATNEGSKPAAIGTEDAQPVSSVVALPVPQLGRCTATKVAAYVPENIN